VVLVSVIDPDEYWAGMSDSEFVDYLNAFPKVIRPSVADDFDSDKVARLRDEWLWAQADAKYDMEVSDE
jgi:hypothetical protein